MTGPRYERELTNRLDRAGYAAVRAPTSGSATDRDLPDVLAGRPKGVPVLGEWREREYPDAGENDYIEEVFSDALAIEAKSGQATTLYVAPEEVAALERFADAFGARALLAARFTTQGSPTAWFLCPPENCRRTEAGAYGLPVADMAERAEMVLEKGGEA